MEDELDDKIIYQTYVSHMRFLSKLAWGGLPLNLSPATLTAHSWRMFRLYCLRPEVLLVGTLLLVMVMYLQSVDVWTRNVIGKLQLNLGAGRKDRLALFIGGDVEKSSWELKQGPIAGYAVQGRRPKMEDRMVIEENINGTDVALLAVFDGHGGEFAANYARDKLVKRLLQKVVEIKDLISGKAPKPQVSSNLKDCEESDQKPQTPSLQERRKSFKKTTSTTDECIKGAQSVTDNELLTKIENMIRPITREVKPSKPVVIKDIPNTTYFNKQGSVDYGKLITDEVLAADQLLVEAAKKTMDVAGTTAIIAILEGSKLVVGNVGDSRGVMCDGRGNAIPLSFDHKPQQVRERKRIKEAGGFVTFNGVWRVAGILATSRALGDYPLKDKKLVIADPDILTFDLKDHKPLFFILASDGLWDTFSNEEAVAFIKERLHEPDFGAKSLTLQSYYRGSLDNITVLVARFAEGVFTLGKSG